MVTKTKVTSHFSNNTLCFVVGFCQVTEVAEGYDSNWTLCEWSDWCFRGSTKYGLGTACCSLQWQVRRYCYVLERVSHPRLVWEFLHLHSYILWHLTVQSGFQQPDHATFVYFDVSMILFKCYHIDDHTTTKVDQLMGATFKLFKLITYYQEATLFMGFAIISN